MRRLRRSVSRLDLGDLFDLSRTLPKEALVELTTALTVIRDPRLNFRHGSAFSRSDAGVGAEDIHQQGGMGRSGTGKSGGSLQVGAESGKYGDMLIPGALEGIRLRKFEKGSMLCVDLLCRVVCANPHR